MKGTVTEVKPSTSGKSYAATIGGARYSAKLDSRLEQAVGKPIDFTIDSSEYKGKVINWVATWDYDRGTASVGPPQAPASIPAQTVLRSNPPDRWYMPFISNTVAHAIQAGLVKDSPSLSQWASAAYRAAMQIENAYLNKIGPKAALDEEDNLPF